jgi:hypothetical protein
MSGNASRAAAASGSVTVLPGMPHQHCLHHGLQGVGVNRDDLPKNGVVDAKILMTDTVADTLDLRPRLGREFRQPVVRNAGTASEMVWIA